jgi:hypothetical protein
MKRICSAQQEHETCSRVVCQMIAGWLLEKNRRELLVLFWAILVRATLDLNLKTKEIRLQEQGGDEVCVAVCAL